MNKPAPSAAWIKSMNEAVTIARAARGLHEPAIGCSASPQHPQSLLDLPHGEARQSLLTVHAILEARLPATELAIYEAGGGSTSFLPLGVLRRAHVTVVDIDEDQIRNNDYAEQTILGDIQTYRFPRNSFDLVICYNVIEHVPDVEAALTGFYEALKPGGLILIGAPNPKSLSGFVTKYSPHWFHVWFYRHIRGDQKAGLPGCAPFPTHFHPLVTLSNLEAFAEQHGLQMIYRKQYESPRYPEMRLRTPVFAALVDATAKAMNFLLPRKGDVRHGDYHVILRKH
jgi:SAM-dependent methyltransferase